MKTDTKLYSLKDAVREVKSGSHITLGGFAHSLAPLAFVREMIRQDISDLEVTAMGEAWAVDMLSGAKALKKVRMSNFMFEGWGRCRNFSRAVEEGEIEVEDYSHFGITNRMFAGSMGIPFIPVKTMSGSDIYHERSFEKNNKFVDYTCPFTEEKVLLVPKVEPDVAIIHASRADVNGNVQLYGISSTLEVAAKSAKKVIVTVEEIVEEEIIRKQPELTILPSFLVDAVIHLPYGAHPAGMYKYYDYDSDHINLYIESTRTNEKFKEYMEEYIKGTENEIEYLEKIGLKQLLSLKADPYYGYSLHNRGEVLQ
ncbi:CoA transferase subunit A [Salibacterium aidingense]|uniref:CoA transferase subunit A n=1 Tax=Salibacterium aidingense TaxID=384933 RepID=UPI0003F595C8|nr:CoA-transferase [Salibacterium aidingense]